MKDKLFEEYPVPKAIMSLALPTMLGMLVNVIYNMADTFFVGQTGDANQVAAVTLSMPIFLLLMAFGNMFGIGGGSYISRLLGMKDGERVKKVSAFSFYTCMAVGFLCMAGFLIFMPQILSLAGTSENTYEFARSYLTVIAYGAPMVCLSNAMSQMVRAEGAAKESTIGMMIGTVINIVLDPIMILYMGLGVGGAAWATIVGNSCSVLFYIGYILKSRNMLSVSPRDFTVDGQIITNIMFIGIPASINNVLMSVANIILNNFAAIYGDQVVAALGIVNRINTLIIMLLIGLAQGMQPFAGYNYAAGNYKRMNQAIRFCIAVGVGIGTAFFAVVFLFSHNLVRIFINDAQIIEYGAFFIKATMFVAPVLAFQFIFMSTFQAIGKAVPSLIISLLRQGLAFIPVIIIGNRMFGLNGIVFAQPIADIISISLSTMFYLYIYRKLKRKNSGLVAEGKPAHI